MKRIALTITMLAILMLPTSCHTKRNVATTSDEATLVQASHTSLALSAYTDSLARSLAFHFDSLEMTVEPIFPLVQSADSYRRNPTSRVRLKVSGGHITRDEHATAQRAEAVASRDTIVSVAEKSAVVNEVNTKTVGYEPPDLIWLFAFAAFIAVIAYIIIRYRRK